jgi:SAM-dependent methyltransferase
LRHARRRWRALYCVQSVIHDDERVDAVQRLMKSVEPPMPDASTTRRLNVGCGRNIIPGWINLDAAALAGVDIVADLESCRDRPLPIESDSVDEFLLSHVLEHIRDSLGLMQDLHRVAKAGATAVIRLPYGSSDDAWEDQTHIRAYFTQSFGYFSQPYYWRADYGYRGDWQPRQITLFVDADLCGGLELPAINEMLHSRRNVVREMVAELVAIKPAREPRRDLQELPCIDIRLA